MKIGVLGVNYRETSLQKRAQFRDAIRWCMDQCENRDYVEVFTCNRTEVYFASSYLDRDMEMMWSHVSNVFHVYRYWEKECLSHLISVTCGCDSALFGETEIQGQIKRCYEHAKIERDLSPELHFAFQKALKEGKQFRSQYQYALQQERGLAEIIRNLLNQHQIHSKDPLLFIGYSSVNRCVAEGLKRWGFNNLAFVTDVDQVTMYPVIRRKDMTWSKQYGAMFLGSQQPLIKMAGFSLTALLGCSRMVVDFNVPRLLPITDETEPLISKNTMTSQGKDVAVYDMDDINEISKQQIDQASRRKYEGYVRQAVDRLWSSWKQRQVRTSYFMGACLTSETSVTSTDHLFV